MKPTRVLAADDSADLRGVITSHPGLQLKGAA